MPPLTARRLRLAALGIALVATMLPSSIVLAASDTDGDGLLNTYERDWTKTSTTKRDTDGDGLRDDREDPDIDGLTNRQEYVTGTRPRRADTDRDGTRDDRENPDGDALRNATEFLAGTHPRRGDSDRDGIGDGKEDPDRDGLSNSTEQKRGTHPRRADTDGDGYTDSAEIAAGTDPRDAASHPVPVAGSVPTVPGAPDCGIFPASNVWNTRVDGRAVATNSATMISAIGLDRGLHMDFGSYAGY
ncbi:MAG TPA: hypothetical protein VF119_04420, partial [Candidatus Limnocylindrales bacterium]